tara:strand:- start:52 stop:501 length:450 start_codon:yes stop_codon:yes gene_type:complete
MRQTAVCALIGMTNAFGAMDNQWLMWDKFTEINGPEDLMTLQTQDLHGKEWKEATGAFGQDIYDEDGDGVEDNVHMTHKQLDKFYKPNNFFPTEDLYNTRHGNLPGHIQAYYYRGQDEPESRDLITKNIINPDPVLSKPSVTGGFGWGI